MINNHIGQIRSSLPASQVSSSYAHPHVSDAEADQEEFEKQLEAPTNHEHDKTGWNAANQKQFNLSVFQMEHGRAMAHDARMKEIWNSMDDTGKSKAHRR